MGTNYYVRTPACENACEHCSKASRIHLGKSSGGWRFLHRAYRDDYRPPGLDFPVTDRASWLKLLDIGPIIDEYDVPRDREEFLGVIEGKQDGIDHVEYMRQHHPDSAGDFQADGYDFCDREFS